MNVFIWIFFLSSDLNLLRNVRVPFQPMERHNDSINDHDFTNLNKTYTINLLETEAERNIHTRTV